MPAVPNDPGSDLGTAIMTARLAGEDALARRLVAECDDVDTLRAACAFLSTLAEGHLVAVHGREQAAAMHRFAVVATDPDAKP